MANKNQKRIRRFMTGETGNAGVISYNAKRNTQMRVLKNEGGGKSASLTVHEPITKTLPMRFKNHSYIRKDEYERNQYKQLPNVRY